ncbi:NADPH-dependent 2,4-dienoyl-CoA reductase, sulfur reductase [Desulfatibacillum alkenivorans DSM 16219]|uniref:NADPH-dependent 2,4-dienoyl-CoA reductase, sulfur reductase n=1 Tax=Desulfatibacillum alkenivorans DSM 16219 TaxID=1121393 RepID=A0A1M6HAB3_9BACT|nr:FAD-dependent oxidoreductase [Desulfatibacillum alkenivorans]SHJ19039.1 NADPH-dependent 2,4-dienoyl-CoA reductase, sulfur reductase [Desulfatibacillum alkenivorans DSM 16219]
MRFLVIGGDAAGMSAASRAKRLSPDMEVIVLEKTEDVSYSACGMPYNIGDESRDLEDLVVRKAQAFRDKQGINLLTGHEALELDPGSKAVRGRTSQGEDFEYYYDKLLIATGGSAVIPPLEGMDSPGVLPLKSLEHARRIKSLITNSKVKKAVILGMGYIGLEMCEALTERGVEVSMVKPNPMFLPWMDRELADRLQQEVESRGAKLYLGHELQKVENTGSGLKIVCNDLTLDADLLIPAIGITPNSEMASKAGLKTSVGNSIAVDKGLKTSDDNIYSAGDCADAYHVVSGQKTWIPLALYANRGGWAVADNVNGKGVEVPGVAGSAVFKVFDFEAARTGLNMREAEKAGFEPVSVTIKTRSRAHGHPGNSTLRVHMVGDKKTGRLLGIQMVGRDGCAHRINTGAAALHSRMTAAEFSQMDLAYAPPFGPVWDPLLTAANQLVKKL